MKPSPIVWENWPEVPQAQRPKKLFVASGIASPEVALLSTRGWELVDIRLLPAETDDERRTGIKACLEGIRLGSINATDGVAKYIELEAKIYGLLVQKESSGTDKQLDGATLDELLSVGDKWTGTFTQQKPSSKELSVPVKSRLGKEQ